MTDLRRVEAASTAFMEATLRIALRPGRSLVRTGGVVHASAPDAPDLDFPNAVYGLWPEEAPRLPAIKARARARGLRPWLELWPGPAAPALEAELRADGARVMDELAVHAAPLAAAVPAAAAEVAIDDDPAGDTFARTLLEGHEAPARAIEADAWALARWGAVPGLRRYLAGAGVPPAGAAAVLFVHGDVAYLANASTLPDARRRGLHGALVARRLADARTAGAVVAAGLAEPGSGSARSFVRAGLFEVARVRRLRLPGTALTLGRPPVSCRRWSATTPRRSRPAGSGCGTRSAPSRRPTRRTRSTTAGRTPTCWRCCRTPPASCTSATSPTTRWATSSRTSGAARASSCCTRWATTRSGCRPRTPPSRRAGTRRDVTRENIAKIRVQARRMGWSIDWSRELADVRSRVLPLDAVDLPAAVRARPGVQEGRDRQLVPRRPDGAGQRAGHRRPLRALRRRGRGPLAAAVVLPHHGLRRSPARRHGVAGELARARADDAAQLDRPLARRARRLPRARPGRRAARLHDAARHAVRRDLLRAGAGAPRRRRLVAGTEREAEVLEYVRHAARESAAERANEDRPKTGVDTGRTVVNPVNGERIPVWVSRLRADGVRHRRDHGRAGARRARPRVRARVRAADPPGRRAADGGARRGRGRLRRPRRRRGDGQLRPVHAACAPTRRCRRWWTGWRRRAAARRTIAYRLRDWLVSRQRYWGAPIPVVDCPACGLVAVPGRPAAGAAARGRGLRAARAARRWPPPRSGAACRARQCGGEALRETDTMDTFVDSSWYFIRYVDAQTPTAPGIAARSTGGCRSGSTSAASSTPSCTCCTRASS